MRRRALSAAGSPIPARCGTSRDRAIADDIDTRLIRPVQLYLEALRIGLSPGPSLGRTWHAFYAAADPVVRAAARSCLRNPEEQADGSQEAWREILDALPTYRHDPALGLFRDWLFILARRACIRLDRRKRGGLEPLSPFAEHSLEGPDSSPWTTLERDERRERIRRGFAKFRGQVGHFEYLAAVIYWVGGRSRRDVAARLNLTSGQVHGHLCRAAIKLRAALDEDG